MKLKVRLFRVKDTGVLGWIEEQEGIERGCGIVIEDDYYTIKSCSGPDIDNEVLYIRGRSKEYDNVIFFYNFDSHDDRECWLKHICALIRKVNGETSEAPSEIREVNIEEE